MMQHPFLTLKPDYESWIAHAVIRPDKMDEVEAVARHCLNVKDKFRAGCEATGVPILWAAPSFYRESDLDFRKSPAQGDRWDRRSIHVPAGRGPFDSFTAAQEDAYRIDHLDRVGAGNWTLEMACYFDEEFNGFAYRDRWHIRSPYVVGGLTIQQRGKYVADHDYNAGVMDSQLGCLAIMLKMAELDPSLALPSSARLGPLPAPPAEVPPPSPMHAIKDVAWTQAALNEAAMRDAAFRINLSALGGDTMLLVDGNYGRKTKVAVRAFEAAEGLQVDSGIAGPQVIGKLEQLLGQDWRPAQ